jgi:hypothetical protein
MEHSELLRYLVAAIERLGLSYMVTGSVATIFFGETTEKKCTQRK